MSAIDVPSAGIEGPLGGIVNHGVNVPANDWVVWIAKIQLRRSSLLLKMRISAERIREFDGLAAVGRIVNVDGHGSAEHVAVIAPHEHFRAVDVPGVNAV